jgi:23S rRNA (cytidine1920-2'-O)/16S rRNA (cytidine1409-2'-O)-methyltransferase
VPTKQRIDLLLVERGLADSRTRAQSLIMAGVVYSDTRKIAKSGELLPADAPLEVKGKDHPWVSRGGLKLDHALAHFKWDISGAVVIDVGSSTGGFTDVALSRGAAKVFAVDVGEAQLAWRLRTDDRVVVLEKTNARHLSDVHIPEAVDLIVCDASFIGLELVLPAAMALTKPTARLVALIKPQFEVGKERVGKGGVVRDVMLHQEVCARIENWMNAQTPWHVLGITPSPITGPEGNIEFLIAAEKRA